MVTAPATNRLFRIECDQRKALHGAARGLSLLEGVTRMNHGEELLVDAEISRFDYEAYSLRQKG